MLRVGYPILLSSFLPYFCVSWLREHGGPFSLPPGATQMVHHCAIYTSDLCQDTCSRVSTWGFVGPEPIASSLICPYQYSVVMVMTIMEESGPYETCQVSSTQSIAHAIAQVLASSLPELPEDKLALSGFCLRFTAASPVTHF